MTKSSKGSAVCAVVVVLGYLVNAHLDADIKTSAQGLAFIAGQEQCRLTPYQCSAGVWTSGIGHAHVAKAKRADVPQVARWFHKDITQAERVVNHNVSLPAGPVFDMAVDFVFNLGAGNFKSSTYLKQLKAANYNAACNELTRWVYVNGKDCRIEANNCAGIVKRRAREREICLYGYRQ